MTTPQRAGQADRLPRWTWAVIGAIGSALGFFVDLYTDEVRQLIESEALRLAVRWLAIAAIVLATSATTWLARDWMWRRRRARETVQAKVFDITVDDFFDALPTEDAVIGRQLHYLERETNAKTLVVFLHGLGLDAGDFRRFMLLTNVHTVAITLFGFNVAEANDDRYRPIGLGPHTDLVAGAIRRLQQKHPAKDLVLVGFSLGADLLLRLAQLWAIRPDRAPRLKMATLLDPNVNSSTMNISTAIAQMDIAQPLVELKRIAAQAQTPAEFHNVCEYLHKITSKNLEQIRRHAREFVDYWRDEGPGQFTKFLQRLGGLTTMAGTVRVVFSFHYEEQFNALVQTARVTGTQAQLQVTQLDHFNLISDEQLQIEVAAIASASRRPG